MRLDLVFKAQLISPQRCLQQKEPGMDRASKQPLKRE